MEDAVLVANEMFMSRVEKLFGSFGKGEDRPGGAGGTGGDDSRGDD